MSNMIMWSISSALWFGAIGAWALPNAIDAEHENSVAASEQRNADNIVDIDDDAEYFASEQYKVGKRANSVLRDIRESDYE